MTEQTELAWAAGFFDGEGHVHASTTRAADGRGWLRVQVHQIDTRVLERFRAAVGGVGRIGGPYQNSTENSKPIYVFQITTSRDADDAMRLIYPYLSEVKREQYEAARAQCVIPGYRPGYCKADLHDLSEPRARCTNGACRLCRNEKRHGKKDT